jgi:hypothetical protein
MLSFASSILGVITNERNKMLGKDLVDWFGTKIHRLNGEIHRENAPAVEWYNGKNNQWWVHGKRLSPEKEAILNKWWDNKNGKY